MPLVEISESTFRAYKIRNGDISLRLKGYLIINTNTGFNFEHYLRDVRCWLIFPNNIKHECRSVGIGVRPKCNYDGKSMLHELWISTILTGRDVSNCVVDMEFMYHLNFTGHQAEEPVYINRKAVIEKRF